MSSLPIAPLELVGVEVPLSRLEKEISQQMKASLPGEIDEAPVQRVRMSNLVIFCERPETGSRLSAEVDAIVKTHPARVLLLVGDSHQPPSDITARVLVQCRLMGRRQQGCTEQIILQARGHLVHRLPFVVRSLLIGDLPTNLWWAASTPPPLASELLLELSETAQQIIYDSIGWTDPARGVAATAAWLEGVECCTGGRWRVASDLNWRRLKYWRRILSESLGEASAPGAAQTITRLVIEHGPHAVVKGYLLVSWIAQRLGWQLERGRATGGTETTWRFRSAHGEPMVILRRLPDGEATLNSLRIFCTLENQPVLMTFQPQPGGRLAITLEGIDAAARTVTIPPQSPAELIGRQLSDRERDPVFRQSMSMAQQLARSVLG